MIKTCPNCNAQFDSSLKRAEARFCTVACTHRAASKRRSRLVAQLPLPANIKELLEFNIERVTESGCWLWTGRTNPRGYGQIAVPNSRYAHRVAYEAYKGSFDKNLFVCHKCDTPSCINPDHLFLGTHSDNMKDAIRKGRRSHIRPPRLYGEQHALTKVTEAQALEIKFSTESTRKTAKRYGLCQATVSSIRTGRTWKQLPERLQATRC